MQEGNKVKRVRMSRKEKERKIVEMYEAGYSYKEMRH